MKEIKYVAKQNTSIILYLQSCVDTYQNLNAVTLLEIFVIILSDTKYTNVWFGTAKETYWIQEHCDSITILRVYFGERGTA